MNHNIDSPWLEINTQYLFKNVNNLHRFLEQKWHNKQNTDLVDKPTANPTLEIPPNISPSPALVQLITTFNLSVFEVYLLLMGVGVALFPQFSFICANLHQNQRMNYPTFGLGLQLFDHAHWSAFTPHAPLRRWQLFCRYLPLSSSLSA